MYHEQTRSDQLGGQKTEKTFQIPKKNEKTLYKDFVKILNYFTPIFNRFHKKKLFLQEGQFK